MATISEEFAKFPKKVELPKFMTTGLKYIQSSVFEASTSEFMDVDLRKVVGVPNKRYEGLTPKEFIFDDIPCHQTPSYNIFTSNNPFEEVENLVLSGRNNEEPNFIYISKTDEFYYYHKNIELLYTYMLYYWWKNNEKLVLPSQTCWSV